MTASPHTAAGSLPTARAASPASSSHGSAGASNTYPGLTYPDASRSVSLGNPSNGAGRAFTNDPVNRPKHYTAHASGVECIQITEHFNFCLGNAIKYIWRADLKWDAVEDLEKAAFYIAREIERRKK